MTREEIFKELSKLSEQQLNHWKGLVVIKDKVNLLLSVEPQSGEKAEAAAKKREQREKDANEAAAKKTNEKQVGKPVMEKVDEAVEKVLNEPDEVETRDDGKSKCFACSKWFVDLPKHQKSCSYLKKLEDGPSEEEKEDLDLQAESAEEVELEEISVADCSKLFGAYAQQEGKETALKILDEYGVKSVSKMSDDQRAEAAAKIRSLLK